MVPKNLLGNQIWVLGLVNFWVPTAIKGFCLEFQAYTWWGKGRMYRKVNTTICQTFEDMFTQFLLKRPCTSNVGWTGKKINYSCTCKTYTIVEVTTHSPSKSACCGTNLDQELFYCCDEIKTNFLLSQIITSSSAVKEYDCVSPT